MLPWIHVFSKFTPEALLLEFFILFLLTCAYTTYWVLKKRKYGVIQGALPAGPVRAYLNDLINQTEDLTVQLFGIASLGGQRRGKNGLIEMSNNEETSSRISELEEQLKAQSAILETTAQENSNLSAELEKMRQNQEVIQTDKNEKARMQNAYQSLSEKILVLETRLAEYAIIEEDLADLKRYQNENSQMKDLLKQNNITFSSELKEKFVSAPQSTHTTAPEPTPTVTPQVPPLPLETSPTPAPQSPPTLEGTRHNEPQSASSATEITSEKPAAPATSTEVSLSTVAPTPSPSPTESVSNLEPTSSTPSVEPPPTEVQPEPVLQTQKSTEAQLLEDFKKMVK
ncbi:hypothetical protein EBS43_09650 [bacterium]|jgi:hypothetical protein|nr:hypothetical protein [bacterium]